MSYLAALLSCALSAGAPPLGPPRPELLARASADETVFYFGIGSNMLRSKLENRGLNGSTISLLSMRPALVRGQRLAFNMRGFPPLEPGMGALEPAPDAVCHGALCEMRRDEYEKVWLSEGGGQPNPGYEEVVVEACPYGETGGVVVEAIALRARTHARLATDACPTQRYLSILIKGATELGVQSDYVARLRALPTQRGGWFVHLLSVHHLFLVTLLFKLKCQPLVKMISKALWMAYVPTSQASQARRFVGGAATGVLLMPSALLGALVRLVYYKASGRPTPPMMRALMERNQQTDSTDAP